MNKKHLVEFSQMTLQRATDKDRCELNMEKSEKYLVTAKTFRRELEVAN